jgi:hypothetical protein
MLDGSLIPSSTIGQICAHRDLALKHFADAHQKLTEADAALAEAITALSQAAPAGNAYYHGHQSASEDEFLRRLKLPTAEAYLALATKIVDTRVWSHLVATTDLERLMDATAKAQLREQLTTNPAPATEETIRATLETLILDSGMIFRRGVATAFSNLDRRFKSHDGWRIGNRIIIANALNECGSWSYRTWNNPRHVIADVERIFLVIDGKQSLPSHLGLVTAIDGAKKGYGPFQGEVETDYIRARVFMNGNVHLWFTRPDLVMRVNQLIGEYYGTPIPEERAPDFTADILRPKTGIAKNFGFYPTPKDAADLLLGHVRFGRVDPAAFRVLEPSAGTGNLARLAVEKGATVDCVEFQSALADGLRESGLYRSVITGDFLALTPKADYDAVIMNPPFDHERDIDHVLHALAFLKPGGQLAAIMSAGTEFRETKKSVAFRAIVEKHGGVFLDLPPASFASVGTNVNTVILHLRKRA